MLSGAIQDFNPLYTASWHYFPTASNTADLVTRGLTLNQLKTSPIWRSGPPWLTSEKDLPQWNVSTLVERDIF